MDAINNLGTDMLSRGSEVNKKHIKSLRQKIENYGNDARMTLNEHNALMELLKANEPKLEEPISEVLYTNDGRAVRIMNWSVDPRNTKQEDYTEVEATLSIVWEDEDGRC